MNLQRGQDGKSNENGGERENRQYKRNVEKRMEEGDGKERSLPLIPLRGLDICMCGYQTFIGHAVTLLWISMDM